MLWFRAPEKLYIKKGCLGVALDELKNVLGKKRAFIVTDQFLYTNYDALADEEKPQVAYADSLRMLYDLYLAAREDKDGSVGNSVDEDVVAPYYTPNEETGYTLDFPDTVTVKVSGYAISSGDYVDENAEIVVIPVGIGMEMDSMTADPSVEVRITSIEGRFTMPASDAKITSVTIKHTCPDGNGAHNATATYNNDIRAFIPSGDLYLAEDLSKTVVVPSRTLSKGVTLDNYICLNGHNANEIILTKGAYPV